jgi:hypothetical protein
MLISFIQYKGFITVCTIAVVCATAVAEWQIESLTHKKALPWPNPFDRGTRISWKMLGHSKASQLRTVSKWIPPFSANATIFVLLGQWLLQLFPIVRMAVLF